VRNKYSLAGAVMSEYVQIEGQISEDGTRLSISTNLTLSEEGDETYASLEAMEEGSALAQALSVVEGIVWMRIEEDELTIVRNPGVPWHTIEADVSAVLKDFFL
jgi:hypothetical protein